MTDRPSPSLPTRFLNAALALLAGSIALYLAVNLLKQIAVPLAIVSCLVIGGWMFKTWRKHSGHPFDDW